MKWVMFFFLFTILWEYSGCLVLMGLFYGCWGIQITLRLYDLFIFWFLFWNRGIFSGIYDLGFRFGVGFG